MPGMPFSQRSDSELQLQESMEKYAQHPQDQPACPESRTLYNELVSQLSMAACEAEMEHMAIRCPSTASTISRDTSLISRDTSLIAASGVSSRPGSMTSNGSPIGTEAFQDLLFKMLEEEWAAHTQVPGGPQ